MSRSIMLKKNVNYVEHASLLWNIWSDEEAAIVAAIYTKINKQTS